MSELVVAACRLVATDNGAPSVRIVAPGRPTYDELSGYRETAQTSHVRLTVSGTGLITVQAEQCQRASAKSRPPEERGASLKHQLWAWRSRFVVPRKDATVTTLGRRS